MKSLAIIVAFFEFIIVTSLDKRHGVSLSLNAPNKIPLRGFLIDNNDDTVSSSKLKPIVKMMKAQQDQLNKIKAASKENSNGVSAVQSKLTAFIKKVKDDQQNQLNKIKAASTENNKKISAIKSTLTDLRKVVNALKKRKQGDGYIGCYKDDSNKHLGYKEVYFRNSLTLAKCREHCKGFKYLGLQNRIYCLCGNILENKKYPRVPESTCNVPCVGEKRRMCGASYINSIYLVNP